MSKDLNYIVKLERAIKERYGDEVIQPPQWSEEKESEYQNQLKKIFLRRHSFQKEEIIEKNGYYVESKLFNKDKTKICPKCKKYTKYIQDDLFLLKFGCCYFCYLNFL